MKRILATVLLMCVVVSSMAILSSCEKNEFTSMIPGLNATMDLIEELAHVHRLELVAQVDPTCNDAGTKSYYACKGCDVIFADENGEIVITSPDLIERLSHAYDDEYDADCNLCGDVRKAKCRHTNKVTLDAKTETCTETGLTAGEQCNDCGEILVAQQTIPSLGHIYDNDQDTTCGRCDNVRCLHISTEAAGEETESTCSVPGLTEGVKCSDCGEIIEEQQQKPLKDHTEVADEAKDPGCANTGLTAGSHCSVCNQAIKVQETIPANGHAWDGIRCTTCGAVKFEAEDSKIETDIDRLGAGMQSGKTPADTNYPSGDGYVYYLSDAGNATLTFVVNSSKEGKAVLSFCFGLSHRYTVAQLFTLTVNGAQVDYYESAIVPKYDEAGVKQYFGWYEVEVADVNLIEGQNTIVLTRNEKGLNFDYIALRSTDGAIIGDANCAVNGHTYGDWTVTTAPTYESAGQIKKVCSACSDTVAADIPVVSTENGYTLISEGAASVWEYTYEGTNITVSIESTSATVERYPFVAGTDTDPFISVNGGSTTSTLKTEDGVGTYYGNASNKSFTYTFKVNVEKATNVTLLIRCAKRYGPYTHSEIFGSLTLNGSTNGVTYTNDTIEWGTDKAAWGDFKDYALATLSLKKGTNTIEFTVITSCNVEAVIIESIIPVALGIAENEPEHVCADSLTKTDAADAACESDGCAEYYTCSCGKIYSDAEAKNETTVEALKIESLGHDKVSHNAQAPTCTEIGWDAYETCSRCDYTTYVEKSSLDHDTVSHNAQAPTCTEIGWDAYVTCSRCDYTTKVEREVIDHNYEWIVDVQPTINADGSKHEECTMCHDKRNENTPVDKLTCTHEMVKTDAVDATCLVAGNKEYYTCSVCNKVYSNEEGTLETTVEDSVIAAIGHDAIAHEGKTPTCTENGYNAYVTCSRCDYSTYSEIPTTDHSYESVVTAPTCEAKGYTTHTCACGDSYVDNYVNALGHTWTEYELVTAPTYENAGLISGSCANCENPTQEIPAVSAENGYTELVGGVVSRWQYSFSDFTFTIDLINENITTKTYSDDISAWCVGFDESGAPVFLEGYKSVTNAKYDTTNLCFGPTPEKLPNTYTTTIVASKDTTVTLILKCARNKAKPFYNDGKEWVIDWIEVNGSSDNVIYNLDAKLTVEGWQVYSDYAIATLFLKEGDNVISFKTATTVNVKGIGFVSTEEIHIHNDILDPAVDAICTKEGKTMGVSCGDCGKVIAVQETIPVSGAHTWNENYSVVTYPSLTSEGKLAKMCIDCDTINEEDAVVLPKVSEANGYTKISSTDTEEKWQYTYNGTTIDVILNAETYTFAVVDTSNPFTSVVDNDGETNGETGISTNKYGTFYQKTKGASFTVTVYVEEATDVSFIIRVCSTNKYSFDYAKAVTSVTSSASGVANAVTVHSGTVDTVGWYTNTASAIEIATISLAKGVNTITFTMGTETDKDLNIAAVEFISVLPVELGKEN